MKNALLYAREVSHLFILPITPITIPAIMVSKIAFAHILIMAIMTNRFIGALSTSFKRIYLSLRPKPNFNRSQAVGEVDAEDGWWRRLNVGCVGTFARLNV
jgi:hypothetical protein